MSFNPDISIESAYLQDSFAKQFPEIVELIEKCIDNDRSAQEALYKKYYGKMMALCLRYVKNDDDAKFILNIGFLKVFKSLKSFNYKGSFDGWVHRIVYNSIIDQIRKDIKDVKTESIEDHENINSNETHALSKLYSEDLYKLLKQVPDTSRIVFNMFVIEGFKHEEISEMLGMSVGTSKWHVNNARQVLKNLIQNAKIS
jgi:RNA polymerase sigma-70 factor (ECF subfamily)